MPFDPAQPANNSALVSQVVRNQLNGLKALIEAILTITAAQVDGVNTLNPGDPANASVSVVGNALRFAFGIPRGNDGGQGAPGNNGNDGAQGPPFAQAIVDAVNTLNPGDAASVSVSFDGSNVRFTFGIPRGNDGIPGANGVDGSNGSNGNDGAQGQPGNNGSDGAPGQTGPQGPPFAQAIIDAVNTLNPGDAASVSVSFDGSNVRFTFGIPRGADGTNGSNGSNGADGAQGQPGEVSNAQLSSAISGTSNNSNAVATLDTPFANDPPTLADMETMRGKFNELVLALRR